MGLILTLLSLWSFQFAVHRPVPYSRSYPIALLGWASLTSGLVLWRRYVSSGIDARRWIVTLAGLCPTFILVSLPQALLSGFGAGSTSLWISVGLIYGVPLYVSIRMGSAADVGELRERLLQCVIVALSIGVISGALELSLRILGLRPYTPVRMTESFSTDSEIPGLLFALRPDHRWGIRYPDNPRGYFGDDNTIWIETNAAGFRDSEFKEEKEEGTIRIALLGDSLGFGYGVRKADGVADRIEETLGKMTGRKVEVYNFSVIGYSTVEEAILLESTVMKYHPDIVVIWFYINDPQYRGVAEDIQSDLYKVFPVLRKSSSFLYLLGSRFDNVIPRTRTVDRFRAMYRNDDPRWIECEESLRKMGEIASEAQVPIYLFFHPVLYNLRGNYPFADIHRKVIETAARFGIKSYDLREAFEGREDRSLWVHPQDMHPNEIAHEIAAQFVSRVLDREFVEGASTPDPPR